MTGKCEGCVFWKGDDGAYMAECGHESSLAARTMFDGTCGSFSAKHKVVIGGRGSVYWNVARGNAVWIAQQQSTVTLIKPSDHSDD